MPTKTIIKETSLSFHFLRKIFQTLMKKDILNLYKDPNRGVCLRKSLDQITLLDIVETVDGLSFYTNASSACVNVAMISLYCTPPVGGTS